MELPTANRVIRKVESGYTVGEEMAKLGEDAPLRVSVSNLIPRLLSIDRGEHEGSRDVGVGVNQANPLSKVFKSFSNSVGS